MRHKIELAKDEATSYARRGLYNLAFYGDSMIVFTNASGLFIVQPNGKVRQHLVDTINRSPNYQFDIANFKTGANDYF